MSNYLNGIQQSNAQFVSSYLSGLNTSTTKGNTGLSGMFNVLGNGYKDYALIQSGTYTKLLRAYYAKSENTAETTDKTTTPKKDDTLSSSYADRADELAAVKEAAKNLKSSVQALNQSSLYEKVSKTEVDEVTGAETTAEAYDWNSLFNAVKEFANNYNTTIDKMAEVSSSTLLKNATWLSNITSSNDKLLNRVGITINENHKLVVDETKFKESDMADVKALFYGSNSYGDKIAYKASNIKNLAGNMVQTLSTGGNRTYTSAGSYSSGVSGSLYDSFL